MFEKFRDECIKGYGLDSAYYFTAPELSWNAILKYTKIEFELLSDYEMLLLIKQGIRGGIFQCSHRYVKANNKYLKS